MTGKRVLLLIIAFLGSGLLWFLIFIIPVHPKYDLFSFIKVKIHEAEQFQIYESAQTHTKKKSKKRRRRDIQRDKILKSFSSQFGDE